MIPVIETVDSVAELQEMAEDSMSKLEKVAKVFGQLFSSPNNETNSTIRDYTAKCCTLECRS